jgi:hypothetical protein
MEVAGMGIGSKTHQRAQSRVRPAAIAASLAQPSCIIARLTKTAANGASHRERLFNLGVIDLPAVFYQSLIPVIQAIVPGFIGSDNFLCPLLIRIIDCYG